MHAPRPRAPLLAWLGGGCFVGSLAYFAWTYYVRFGRVEPDGPLVAPLLVDLALFGGFALHHSVLARSGVKQWLTRRVPPRSGALHLCLGRQPALHRGVRLLAGCAGRGLSSRRALGRSALDRRRAGGLAHCAFGGSDRPARPGRDSAGSRRLGAPSPSRDWPVSLGSSPDLSRMVAAGLWRASHDRDSSRVCGDQFGVPGRRDPIRGTLARRDLWRRVSTVPASRAMAVGPRRLVARRQKYPQIMGISGIA